MTIRHVILGLMQATRARSHRELANKSGIGEAVISRIMSGQCHSLTLGTLSRAQEATRVPLDLIFMWYRLPPGVPLPRVIPINNGSRYATLAVGDHPFACEVVDTDYKFPDGTYMQVCRCPDLETARRIADSLNGKVRHG